MTLLNGSAAVPRVQRASGRLRVPGDKSISHRYALLAGIADGASTLRGYAPGADCAATLACLEALGVRVTRGAALTIEGLGLGGLRRPKGPLDAANSGTSMRLLAGLLSAHPYRTVIGGDASLSRRPMRRVIAPLTQMGATIGAVDGHPPLTIDGAALHGISYVPDIPSAQVKSAILLAGLHAAGRTTVAEPSPTRDHTERAFEAFGVRVVRHGSSVSVDGAQRLQAIDANIPGDISSAVFWMVLASGTPGSDLVIEGVGLNPTRTAVLDILRRAGADIEVDLRPEGRSYLTSGIPTAARMGSSGSSGLQAGDLTSGIPTAARMGSSGSSGLQAGDLTSGIPTPARMGSSGSSGLQAGDDYTERIGTLRVRYSDPRSFAIAPEEVPGVIDEIPGLAALAAICPGVSMTVRGAGELRVKESDRIAMLAKGFRAIGIEVDEYPDGFTIRGGPPSGGEADAADDHRLAMAFAIAGSRARGPVGITGAGAVAVSYPGFFDELERIARGS